MICYDSSNKNMNKQTLVCEKKISIRQGLCGEKNKHVTQWNFFKVYKVSNKHVGWAF